MADKPQVPKPPRPVQAPKQRAGTRPPTSGGRSWKPLAVIAALALVAIAAVLAFLFLRSDPAQALADAGCEVETYESQGQDHVEALPEDFEYNSDPPTTGPHNPVPAPFDYYEDPVDELRLVHNMEHGGVIVHFGDEVPAAQLEALREWWREDPNGIVVTSRPDLGDEIAFAAWTAEYSGSDPEPTAQEGVVARCPGFDEGAAEAFLDEYGFRGPERFERIMLTPGT
jgi:hypothetical protein